MGPARKDALVQAVHWPIAFDCAASRNVEMMRASELGTRRAPAMPCRARPAMRISPVGATAQISAPLTVGGPFPGLGYFLQSLSSTLLWPLADVLLLLPQRRAVNRDENRPI